MALTRPKAVSDTPVVYKPPVKKKVDERPTALTSLQGKATAQVAYKPPPPGVTYPTGNAPAATATAKTGTSKTGSLPGTSRSTPRYQPQTPPAKQVYSAPEYTPPATTVTPTYNVSGSPDDRSTARPAVGMGNLRAFEGQPAAPAEGPLERDYLGGQFWFGSDWGDVAEFKAERERSVVDVPAGRPRVTSQELRLVQKWEASGWNDRYVPKFMSPYMARFANITEAERRKYYQTDYPWGLLGAQQSAETAYTSGSGYGSGYGSGGGGGGGGGGGSAGLPQWYLDMLQWNI